MPARYATAIRDNFAPILTSHGKRRMSRMGGLRALRQRLLTLALATFAVAIRDGSFTSDSSGRLGATFAAHFESNNRNRIGEVRADPGPRIRVPQRFLRAALCRRAAPCRYVQKISAADEENGLREARIVQAPKRGPPSRRWLGACSHFDAPPRITVGAEGRNLRRVKPETTKVS